ncbi:Maf1 regulator-domain-containing protein [Kickxella alabastrina]|uniref:Maf1 regulator-domain-containing protein n=1 Tax=Kickxella alabastrina TaxID=61397 RepID=UPI002220F489|nr:Maf1 regulator-domain-containing protein [Kickxella alabastrina]KAI7834336.1 Maf1 regulator-domain-containing protein [Kickxella alabastrina]
MKYLDIESLRNINSRLSFRPAAATDMIEAYSCKVAGADKKLYRYLEQKHQEDLEEAKSLSPEQSSLTNMFSPFGPLTESASRKVMFYLIATLNASFPDYDFRYVMFCILLTLPQMAHACPHLTVSLLFESLLLYAQQLR